MIDWDQYVVLKIFSEYEETEKPLRFFTNKILSGRIDENYFDQIATELYKDTNRYINRSVSGEYWQISRNGLIAIEMRENSDPYAADKYYILTNKNLDSNKQEKIKQILNKFIKYPKIKRFFYSLLLVIVTFLLINYVLIPLLGSSENKISFELISEPTYTSTDLFFSNSLIDFIKIQSEKDSIPYQYSESMHFFGNITSFMWLYNPVRYDVIFINNNVFFNVLSCSIVDINFLNYYKSKIIIPDSYNIPFLLASNKNNADIKTDNIGFDIQNGRIQKSFVSFLPFIFTDSLLIDSLSIESKKFLLKKIINNNNAIYFHNRYGDDKLLSKDVLCEFFNKLDMELTLEFVYTKTRRRKREVVVKPKLSYRDFSSSYLLK